jgi:hypothetical protein
VSRKVRITAKRRDEIDIEKLALALLGLIRDAEAGKVKLPAVKPGSNAATKRMKPKQEESA